MPTTYEDLYERDKTIYKKGVDGELDTPYATPEQLGLDLGIGSDQIDWGAINPYEAPPQDIPQDIPQAGASATDLIGDTPYDDELSGAEADYYNTLTPEYGQQTTAQAEADVMKKFQQEIDALEAERVAARGRIVSQYGQIGEARQGTSTAIQARRGLVGSTFGSQQKSEMATQTQREQDAALAYSSAQYSERKSTLMGNVRTAQADEAKLRLEASQLGSQAKIEEIRGRKTRQDERVSNTIKNLLSMEADTEDEELMNEVAEGLGISVKDLMSKYEGVKAEAEQEAEKLELERQKTQAEIDKLGRTTLSPGQKLYDSEGNLVAEGEGKTVTLSEGQILYDTNGEIIAMGQPKANTKTVVANGRTLLIDERTGETIKDLGSAYKPSSSSTKTPKIVQWSQQNERAGIVGRPQEEIDEIMNNPTAPQWFNDQAPELYQMSKDNWQTEWEEIRNPILDAFREEEKEDGFSFTKIAQGARNAGMTIEEFKKLDINTQNSYMEEF